MIRVLDPTTAAQIAAGEVVERPASVVKELVENALDAGATRIGVDVRGGGITELRISDDGGGIGADQIELAFARHATSKLRSADDLWAIGTLGFRGEALPSIASISQVTCTSRAAGATTGVELRIAGGEMQGRRETGGQQGTTFSIRNLFYNVPVRREFLRSPAAESAAITQVVTNYALARPDVRFALTLDGRPRLETNGSGHLPGVLLAVYGLDVARAMLPVAYDDDAQGMTHIAASGFVSPPTLSRGSREAMHISINGRAVAARGQVGAIFDEAYHTLLMKGRFPYAVLDIRIHPGTVDVNVHPQKSEVRFRDPERLRDVLARAIRAVLQQSGALQAWDGGTFPAQPDPAPMRRQPFPGAPADPAAAADPEEPQHAAPLPAPPAHALYLAPAADPVAAQHAVLPRAPAAADPVEPQRATPLPALPAHARYPTPAAPDPAAPDPAPPYGRSTASALPTRMLAERRPTDGLPPLRALAQLGRTYLLAEGPEGALYLVDQHAAHERITYERLMDQHARRAIESQALLIPAAVAATPAARAVLLAANEDLGAWGFDLAEAEGALLVHRIPATVAPAAVAAALTEIADHLLAGHDGRPMATTEQLLVTLSCHTSIRAGHPLAPAEQQALIDQLAACQDGRNCPHGRPTVIVLSRGQLERQFGRVA